MSGVWIAAFAIFAVIMLIIIANANTSEGKQKTASTCTKHVLKKSAIPGGPDQLVWQYGPHRTPGNACDGPEHKRVTAYW